VFVIPTTQEAEAGGFLEPRSLRPTRGTIARPFPKKQKQTKKTWTRDVAQVTECLLCNCRALIPEFKLQFHQKKKKR
jgi:hypothetical protein